jgi:hypothetical protein
MSQGPQESPERPIPEQRKRSRSPLLETGTSTKQKRDPRIFIFHCHAITFPGKAGKDGIPALIDPVAVDTFTSAKFGHSFGVYMYNPYTSTFFDEPYTYFTQEVFKRVNKNPDLLQKDSLRKVISDSLCYNRDVERFIFPDTCRFRCHKVGQKMADMYMMTPGAPMNDVILSFDPFTGDVEDAHENFGLVEVKKRLKMYPSVIKEIDKGFDAPISKAEQELDILRSQISTFSQETTPENIKKVRELQKKYDSKFSKLELTREVLKGAVQGAKYVFKPKYENRYKYVDGAYPVITLSDMLDIAVSNGTIDPEIDFVVLQACRKFHGELPSDYDPSKSPGRDDSEPDSQGGGGRATSKHSRKKYGKNKGRNKNKNKRKTIRNRKSIKSRNSRKSRKLCKSRKRSKSL